jgi:hypothetical protein
MTAGFYDIFSLLYHWFAVVKGIAAGEGGIKLSGSATCKLRLKYKKKGLARCMASDNIIKAQEATVSAKPKLKTYKGAEQPSETKLSTFRYVHSPTWCEYGKKCVDGAILPTITVKNMRGKLPPKNRSDVAVSGLGSTRSS